MSDWMQMMQMFGGGMVFILTAGGLWKFFARVRELKSEDQNAQDTLAERYVERMERSYSDVVKQVAVLAQAVSEMEQEKREMQEAHRVEIEGLQAELAAVQAELADLKTSRAPIDGAALVAEILSHMPWPAWITDHAAAAWYLNDAYCYAFSVRRPRFWRPVNILRMYPESVAANYVSEDMAAIESGSRIILDEAIPRKIMQPPSEDNPTEMWTVIKTPIQVRGKTYLFGQAVRGAFAAALLEAYGEYAA